MNKLLYPRHVQTSGNDFIYILNLAGERIKSVPYRTKRQASCEAELFKYYVRARYGTKLSPMRASLPEEELRAYTAEMGYDLSPRSVEIHFPHKIRDLFVDRGAEIGRALAELELPSTKQIIVRETLREARLERQQMKLDRITAQTAASAKRAEIWLKAQQAAAEAWKNAKIEFRRACCLNGVPITREQALAGLGDPATWDSEAKALYAEFEKKPS